ncbi:bifunctional phosphoribosyl-AMP cyclohydrolase/phosphoribosyl-ATP diphosphatase HisIE [Phosphitispora sp. TUW77]|uniref:bifunctional phosphoribosyl-AMP cyclohydrolase/phosphoribosyl-ATP diphosphatase HisIE n=1 Tax=Phosphitispora sp. TUW77 TaxID=3152361 RepID=UPI003AB71CFF
MDFDINLLKFDAHGLIPAIIQDVNTNEVLMMAYMNKESLQKTLETGRTWFWSRSRQELWNKGATSGHYQEVKTISYDCDADSLLIRVLQTGAACHTGERTCFHNTIMAGEAEALASAGIIDEVYDVVMSRKREMPEGSYTTYLFTKGIDKICKKIGEEAAEVIIGAKNRSREEVIYEVGDLIYHLLVLLGEQGIEPGEVYKELAGRR